MPDAVWPTGGGEMGARVRDLDWSRTSLGPIAGWSQSLRTAVNLVLSSPVPIVMLWGTDGIMIYNDAYSVFAGGRHPRLLGSPVLEGWPEVADFNRRVMEVGLSGGTLSFRDQHLVLHRHGRPEDVWMDLSYSPIHDESGTPRGVLAIVAETTQRVLAERQIRELNEALERQVHTLAELDRAKTTFFTNISHEFRTPLTLMLGPTEDALRGRQALSGEDLATVHRNELRLLKLVNALLDFSRIEAGRLRAAFEPTDLARLTEEITGTFRAAVERAGLELAVHCDPVGEVYVDPEMWEKVVLNLLSNALKFTLKGRITVTLRDVDDEVELSVQDTGIGISPEHLPRLFERFHRIEGARGRTQEGSGIGLALVDDLVRLHGGTVSVSSQPAEGTTLTVRLRKGTAHLVPDQIVESSGIRHSAHAATYFEEANRWALEEEVVRGDERFEETTEPATRPDEPFSPLPGHVLVADDNADMRDYLTRVLREHWSVEAVRHGAAALAAMRVRMPDLVVTDVMMPVLNGVGLLREMRAAEATAHIPVIMLSARAGEESRVEGLHLGADDYLTKPFSARELVARVNGQLRLAYATRERRELLASEQQARREAELQKQLLYDLFMQAPMPIAVMRGRDHVVELANAPTCRVWGRRPEDVVGLPLLQAMPELKGQPFKDLLDGVIATGEAHVGNETPARLARSDGSFETVYFTFVYAPLRNANGSIDGVLVVAADVTPQVLARREMSTLREAAEAANRAKDEFLAMLGHELRNPLAPIITALQLLKLRGIEGGERERNIIERQVKHLVGLVDDLLDVSRITRGKVELRREPVETAEFIARAVEVASPLLEQQRHHLTLDVPRSGLLVDGDATRLAQVVANLLTNAAKYTEPGGLIALRAFEDGEDTVVEVRDTGVGIDPDVLPFVFDMFVQERQTIERSRGGLGLGLAIVRSLVTLHGGSVTAQSDGKGQGATFTVRLPRVVAPVPHLEPAADAPAATVPLRSRVLIVDDNEDAAMMLSEMMSAFGFVTRYVHDGLTALRVAEEFDPDIALLDIGLPVMDGFELARRFRAHPTLSRTRLVAITGYGQEQDRRESAAAGFIAHLVKPVQIEQLRDLVDNVDSVAGP